MIMEEEAGIAKEGYDLREGKERGDRVWGRAKRGGRARRGKSGRMRDLGFFWDLMLWGFICKLTPF